MTPLFNQSQNDLSSENIFYNVSPPSSNRNRIFKIVFFAVIFILLGITSFAFYNYYAQHNPANNDKSITNTKSSSITLNPKNPQNVGINQNANITEKLTPTVKVAIKPKKIITSTQKTFTINPTNTIAPTSKTANPPKMSISYPSENQSISLTTAQQFCVVDVPAGGNHTGIQRRQNINNGDWTGYSSVTTLCYTPKEGQNTVMLQYKNNQGEESTQYVRNFTFHQLQPVTVTLTGRLYSDNNCNGTWDSGEGNVSNSSTVNVFKMPEFYILGTVQSGNDGTFNSFTYSKTINEGESLSMQALPVSPEGYKSNPNYSYQTITLNKDSNNYLVNIPQVPNANTSTCTF